MTTRTRVNLLFLLAIPFWLMGLFFFRLLHWPEVAALPFIGVGTALVVWAGVISGKAQKVGEFPSPTDARLKRVFWISMPILAVLCLVIPFGLGYVDSRVGQFSVGMKLLVGGITFLISSIAARFGLEWSKKLRP